MRKPKKEREVFEAYGNKFEHRFIVGDKKTGKSSPFDPASRARILDALQKIQKLRESKKKK